MTTGNNDNNDRQTTITENACRCQVDDDVKEKKKEGTGFRATINEANNG